MSDDKVKTNQGDDSGSYTINAATIDADNTTWVWSGDSYNTTFVGSTNYTIVDPLEQKFKKLEGDLDSIKKRLAILDSPDPDVLEKNKMLREAYNKYKMIEALIGESKNRDVA